jgi:hypothetical protein
VQFRKQILKMEISNGTRKELHGFSIPAPMPETPITTFKKQDQYELPKSNNSCLRGKVNNQKKGYSDNQQKGLR